MDVMQAVLLLAASYLLGSIPFSYLVARLRGVDVRKVGSGNVGATNVMRAAGRTAGVLAFLLDFTKGSAAVVLTRALAPHSPLPALAAVAAVLGHMYPVWLRFRGGKGVATGVGAFAPLVPVAAGVAFLAFGVVMLATRYVSVGSIAGAVTLAVLVFLSGPDPAVARAAAGLALLIVWKHRGNLKRISQGTESRLGRKAAAAP